MADLETQIGLARASQDRILRGQMVVLTVADSIGLDTKDEWNKVDRYLKGRAENLIGRLQIAVTSRDRLEIKIKEEERAGSPEAEISEDRTRLQYARHRIDGVAKSLEETAKLLDSRGAETVHYRQFIIQTTGEITERVLDPRVLIGLLRDGMKAAWQWLRDNAPTFLVKLIIMLAFVVSFRLLFRLGWHVLRITALSKLSRLMRDMAQRMVNPIATIVGLFAGLWFLGVNPGTLLAGVGVAGFIIGFALQESLSNLAAGVVYSHQQTVRCRRRHSGGLGTWARSRPWDWRTPRS